MTEFTKTKIHFALALLGTLFAIHPYVEQWEHLGFSYWKYHLEIFHAYALTGGLLALSVYFYAMALLSERTSTRAERLGNYLYALGILIFPLYGLFYLSSLGEHWLEESRVLDRWISHERLTGIGPALTLALGVFWLLASQVLAWRVRSRLGDQDRSSKIQQLENEEVTALNQAKEMAASNHYDLAVIQAWKALEARLRQALLRRGQVPTGTDAQALLDAAARAGILTGKSREQVEDLRRQWNIAVSTEPLTREAAERALVAARDILSTISLPGAGQQKKPQL
ncbi:MAG TPA: HEPN domain-containing protein [Gemmataceae bacterium]|jgi:HEPN domain-containing protein|nr:HEPN domain-containing protein [Gemmataceae bacterium]